MLEEHYPFVAQPLPYEYDALLPVLDEETLHFHHDKHYQTYVDKLNAILADYPQLQHLFLLLMLLMLALGVYLLVVGCQQGNPPVLLAPFSPQIIGGFFRHV